MGVVPHWSRGSRDSLTAYDEDPGEAVISCSTCRTVRWTTLTADSSGNPLLSARLGTRRGVHGNVKNTITWPKRTRDGDCKGYTFKLL